MMSYLCVGVGVEWEAWVGGACGRQEGGVQGDGEGALLSHW